jgi:hypothetical protein
VLGYTSSTNTGTSFLDFPKLSTPKTLVIYFDDAADIEVSNEKLSLSLVTPDIKKV